MDATGASGREVGGDEGHGAEYEPDADDVHGSSPAASAGLSRSPHCADLEQQPTEQTRRGGAKGQPKRSAADGLQFEAAGNQVPELRGSGGAERHADAELGRPLGDATLTTP